MLPITLSKSKLNFIPLFFIFLCFSCTGDQKFNKEQWLKNSSINDTSNPRAYMTKDLLKNHLKVGFTRDSVIALLGKPYQEGIEKRVPKEFQVPDSLSFTNDVNLSPENSDTAFEHLNEFMRLNSQPDTLMLYPVGWSTIDPNFLVIKFDKRGKAYEFWIEQH